MSISTITNTPFILPQGSYSSYDSIIEADALIRFKTEGLVIYIIPEDTFYYWDGLSWAYLNPTPIDVQTIQNFVFVDNKVDLPAAIGGVITLLDNYTYFITKTVDLTGDRIEAGENTTIMGTSSEVSKIISTGLIGTALITSEWSLPLRNISFTADIVLDLDATGNPNEALDWFGVNFVNCATIGTIANYNNVIISDSAFLESGNLIFDGTLNTIGFMQCLFNPAAGQTAITIVPTATINRRFRTIYSSFVVTPGETGLDATNTSFTNNESYILDTVNFSGGGTYLSGLTNTDNKAFLSNCIGVDNSGNIAQYYMVNNATATTVSATNTFYKIAGTTTSGPYIQKFTLTNNRATYVGAFTGFFKITVVLSASAGNNQVLNVRVAVDGTSVISSDSTVTTSGTGRIENIKAQAIVSLANNNYVEVFIANATATTNITVSDLNVIIERLN